MKLKIALKKAISFLAVCFLALLPAVGPALAGEQAGSQAREKQEEELGFLERPVGDNWVLSPVIGHIIDDDDGAAVGTVAAASKAKGNEVAFAAGTSLTFRTSRTTIFNKSISIASGP